MSAIRQAIVILGIALAPAVFTAAFHPRRPAWEQARSGEVTIGTVQGWGSSVLWVDARPPSEYQAQHMPGAVPLSPENWDNDLPKFLDAWDSGRHVVVYCSSTSCELSHEVAKRLEKSGLSNIYVLQGGWETIRNSGAVR
jgi:rhodanese-related sulfurtransferase